MPNNSKDDTNSTKINMRKVNKLSSFVQSNLDKIYSSTYFNTSTNKNDLEDIKSKLDNSIDAIVNNNRTLTGKSTMSSLYSRAMNSNNDISSQDQKKIKEFGDDLETLLNENNTMEGGVFDLINETNNIYDYDAKIDVILKYMTKLEEALECKKDNVLSADHFSKDFINVVNQNLSGESEYYNEHINFIKEHYNFLNLVDEIYDKAAKYGEQFVYIVPTKKAIARLLNVKSKMNYNSSFNMQEGYILNEATNEKIQMEDFEDFADELGSDITLDNIEVELNKTGMITGVVESYLKYDNMCSSINEMALTESSNSKKHDGVSDLKILTEANKELNKTSNGFKPNSKSKFKFASTVSDDNLTFDNFDYRGQQDGLLNLKSKKNSKSSEYVNIPGSIVKLLDRKNVIPLYIEDKCFGYYYIETEGTYVPIRDQDRMQDGTLSFKGSTSVMTSTSMVNNNDGAAQTKILRYLAGQISSYIDANFVNSNQDLRDEIYMILKYNDLYGSKRLNKLKVTYIPPDDMEHVYFKMDKNTHRGISDLHKSLFPATLFSAMYITNCIWTMTRSQDKRIYYVKQTVDTNISKTLLTTINQIKRGNMGIRQIDNINHIMNIVGRFNDYIVPKTQSGETPIDFEVMNGQQIEFKSELMTMLEESAINMTDIPLEMIQLRQSVEYATQLTMSSSKVLRKVYNRQAKFQPSLTRMFTKLYDNEFGNENIAFEIKLPPPMFLNITNTNQMINNVTDYSTSITDIMLDDEDEKIKKYVIREIIKNNLGTYLNMNEIQNIINIAKQQASRDDNGADEEE